MAELLQETCSQTAGPYIHIGLAPRDAGFDIFKNNFSSTMTNEKTLGERIRIEGRIFDGTGNVIKDATVEAWQANAAGKYADSKDTQDKALDPNFRGWGRANTSFENGVFTFDTIKPGVVVGRKGVNQAPHITLWIAARGINIGLHTRLYFDDEAAANAQDAVLNTLEWPSRKASLIAKKSLENGITIYRHDIYLKGDKETVFFDV